MISSKIYVLLFFMSLLVGKQTSFWRLFRPVEALVTTKLCSVVVVSSCARYFCKSQIEYKFFSGINGGGEQEIFSSSSLSSTTPITTTTTSHNDDQDSGEGSSTIYERATSMEETLERKDALHKQLKALGIDPVALDGAALQSIQNPFQGYDGRFGKSAIRAYRSFLYPKKKRKGSENLSAVPFRTALQIDFLLKRHEAHQTEWIRHYDAVPVLDSNHGDDKESTAQQQEQQQRRRLRPFPLILVLDNIRSALNVGCLFRTADAAGCAGVWTIGISPHPAGNGAEKLAKSALGAERIVPSQHFITLQEAMDTLRAHGKTQEHGGPFRHPVLTAALQNNNNNDDEEASPSWQIIGMETTQKSVDYTRFRYNQKAGVALVLGNEVTGITATMLSQMDAIVEIPTFGIKNSLNVASCAPIVLYEILRQWRTDEWDK